MVHQQFRNQRPYGESENSLPEYLLCLISVFKKHNQKLSPILQHGWNSKTGGLTPKLETPLKLSCWYPVPSVIKPNDFHLGNCHHFPHFYTTPTSPGQPRYGTVPLCPPGRYTDLCFKTPTFFPQGFLKSFIMSVCILKLPRDSNRTQKFFQIYLITRTLLLLLDKTSPPPHPIP